MMSEKKGENKNTPQEKEQKQSDSHKGIPIDNKHVSKDPNKSPQGADKDKHVDQHENYIEPYNRQRYEEDPKRNRR